FLGAEQCAARARALRAAPSSCLGTVLPAAVRIEMVRAPAPSLTAASGWGRARGCSPGRLFDGESALLIADVVVLAGRAEGGDLVGLADGLAGVGGGRVAVVLAAQGAQVESGPGVAAGEGAAVRQFDRAATRVGLVQLHGLVGGLDPEDTPRDGQRAAAAA